MIWTFLILALITGQRLAELGVAGRNTRRLLARGAVESGADHYVWIVVLHSAWLGGLWLLAWLHPVSLFWLAIYLVVQVLRVWTVTSLGDRWTTRIITLPGKPLVRRGPYRFLSHPNYVVVAAEMAIGPLVFGLPLYGALFFTLNGAMLFIRIRAEEKALIRDAPAGALGDVEGHG